MQINSVISALRDSVTGKLSGVALSNGKDGLSAYQQWVAAGNTGTLAQYLASLIGNTGWTPVMVGELDGYRTLLRVADWSGGTGSKPATGMYLGTAGYVTTKAAAFDFNPARSETQRIKASATGTGTIAFATAYPTGYAPTVQLTVEAPAGSLLRHTAQLDGPVTPTGCAFRTFKDALTSLPTVSLNLLGAVIVSVAPSVWVHATITPPAVAIVTP